jgi:hypothetical protein
VKSIRISIPEQTLELDEDGIAIRRYLVSTSKNGVGEKYGSFCTPRGRHIVRAKVGAAAPVNTVFVKRRPTGEIYSPELGSRFPGRDWMLTRLLWLSGCEPGFNRLGDVDTMRRYIYIHWQPGFGADGQAWVDWLHPHAQSRSTGVVRPRRSRHARGYHGIRMNAAVVVCASQRGCASQRNWVECRRPVHT